MTKDRKLQKKAALIAKDAIRNYSIHNGFIGKAAK